MGGLSPPRCATCGDEIVPVLPDRPAPSSCLRCRQPEAAKKRAPRARQLPCVLCGHVRLLWPSYVARNSTRPSKLCKRCSGAFNMARTERDHTYMRVYFCETHKRWRVYWRHPGLSINGNWWPYADWLSRIRMALHLGRDLKPEEWVWHRNRDHTDDSIANLAVAPTKRDGMAELRRLNRWGQKARAQ